MVAAYSQFHCCSDDPVAGDPGWTGTCSWNAVAGRRSSRVILGAQPTPPLSLPDTVSAHQGDAPKHTALALIEQESHGVNAGPTGGTRNENQLCVRRRGVGHGWCRPGGSCVRRFRRSARRSRWLGLRRAAPRRANATRTGSDPVAALKRSSKVMGRPRLRGRSCIRCQRAGQGVRPARGDTVRWILAEVKTDEIFMKPKELSCACPCCLHRP